MSAGAEDWRWLPQYEGWCELSESGDVRVYYDAQGHGRGRVVSALEIPQRPVIRMSAWGYPQFLARNLATGAAAPFQIHRAMMLAFVGRPALGLEVCHFPVPGRLCVSFDNLRYDTRTANMRDASAHAKGRHATLARLADLREQFPHLRSSLDGVAFESLLVKAQPKWAWMHKEATC